MEERWYKLDNAAKIYPAVRGKYWAPMFREDAVLKEDVDPEALQYALLMTYKRFPTFSVNMARGFFWYYFEPRTSGPEVLPEDDYPLRPFSEERDKGYLFRVLYYKKRISLEVFHSISDGFGAAVFLRTLLCNYFSVISGMENADNMSGLERYGILCCKDLPTPEEVEDSFQHYAPKKIGLNLKEKVAFRVPGTRMRKGTLRVTHVLADVKDLQRLSREFDVSITVFATSLLIYSILNARVYGASDKRPVKISVPVDLRRRFPSKTLRNFSSYINVEIQPGDYSGEITIEEICSSVKQQIQNGLDEDSLRSKFSSNVNAERNMMMRAAPLFLKNVILKSTYSLYGERLVTVTLSNLGSITLPDEMVCMVERFDFLCGAPKQSTLSCGVVSFEDTMSISFASNILENSVLKRFVGLLTEHGIEARVETNY
jgi:hypothetical protein